MADIHCVQLKQRAYQMLFGEEFARMLNPANTYLVFNFVACAVYLFLFFVVLRELIKSARDRRNQTAIFIACIFPLLAALFFINALFEVYWPQYNGQYAFYFFALAPAAIIFVFRKQIFCYESDAVRSVRKFNELKDEFLTVASHELRTPLSVIIGFAEILVREKLGSLNDEQKRRVRKILMQAQRLNRIVDNLLDLSRIRSGKVDVKQDVFDLVPVLKACLDDHQIVCDQQKIKLCDEVSDVLPDVVGDLERVTQVIINLLNNAVKYTPLGGNVTIKAYHAVNDKHVRVEVWDTGIGLAAVDQEKIFHEFYRATDQHARKYAGSGLGLAIVKQLVESQGGVVGVQSEGLNKGSMFFFTLPISEKKKADPSKAGAPSTRVKMSS